MMETNENKVYNTAFERRISAEGHVGVTSYDLGDETQAAEYVKHRAKPTWVFDTMPSTNLIAEHIIIRPVTYFNPANGENCETVFVTLVTDSGKSVGLMNPMIDASVLHDLLTPTKDVGDAPTEVVVTKTRSSDGTWTTRVTRKGSTNATTKKRRASRKPRATTGGTGESVQPTPGS